MVFTHQNMSVTIFHLKTMKTDLKLFSNFFVHSLRYVMYKKMKQRSPMFQHLLNHRNVIYLCMESTKCMHQMTEVWRLSFWHFVALLSKWAIVIIQPQSWLAWVSQILCTKCFHRYGIPLQHATAEHIIRA